MMYDYELIHQKCDKPAFYLNFMPKFSDPLTSDGVINIDGKKINKGDRVICGSCGAGMTERELHTDYIKKRIVAVNPE